MVSLYDLNLAELTEFCSSLGERPFRARQLYAWLYGKGENDFAKMTDIPASAREKLTMSARADGLVFVEALSSKDKQTTKYLFETDDEFAEIIKKLAELSDDERKALAKSVRQSIEERSTDNIAKHLINLYRKAMGLNE